MSRKKKQNFRPQFRGGKTANNGHPTYVYARDGDDFYFIGLTHSEITGGVKNILLDVNPNPNDSAPSYIRPYPGSSHYKNFGARKKSWSFAKRDKDKVNSVIKKGKKKGKSGF